MTPAAITTMIEEGRHLVPDHLWPGLRRYFVERGCPGDFLVALLANDLMEAVGRADEVSFAALPRLCQFLHNFTPGCAHGSEAVIDAWLEQVEPRA